MNKIILIGNLTREPDPVRTTANGVDVCSFTIAVDRKGAKGADKVTDYFRISAWGKIAMPCHNFLSKGKKVCVVGELQARIGESKDGKSYLNLDVRAEEVEFLSPAQQGVKAPADPAEVDPNSFQDIPADDLPF